MSLAQVPRSRLRPADACLMHLAERDGIQHVFTLDRRHFRVFRTSNGRCIVAAPPGASLICSDPIRMPRILSISGLRGVIGDGLDPEYVTRLRLRIRHALQWRNRDPVPRRAQQWAEWSSIPCWPGCWRRAARCLMPGISTTPTCGVLVTELKAAGGLQITASHNPSQWNGLKPFSPAGSCFDAAQGSG